MILPTPKVSSKCDDRAAQRAQIGRFARDGRPLVATEELQKPPRGSAQSRKEPHFRGPLPQWQSQPPLRPTTRSSISVAGTSVRHASQSVVIFQAFPLPMAHPKDLVLLFTGDKPQASPELRSGSAPPRSPGISGSGSLGSLFLSYVQMLVVHNALLGQAHLGHPWALL